MLLDYKRPGKPISYFPRISRLVLVLHYVKSIQIRCFLWSIFSRIGLNTERFSPHVGKYGPEKTTYLDN